MKLTQRPYRDEEDYWRIRAFLREVFLLNERRELSWQAARLDYWRWHVVANCAACDPVQEVTFIWETPDGRIAAVLNPEGGSDVHLQVHPTWRAPELEEEMIALAEERLGRRTAGGKRKLHLWAHGHDDLRPAILRRRGYRQGDWTEYRRRRWLDAPLPGATGASGYAVRALGDVDELPARSWASWRAFHPDEPDEAYEGWEWYHNVQRMPLYRRDLDVVAVAPGGEIAAFCTVWYDDVTRSGYFEPVGTVPEHQRRGLGKAVMCEALRRLARLGAVLATVGGYATAANALYGAVMSPQYEPSQPWIKEL